MSGAGNLFTVFDNRNHGFDVPTLKLLAPLLCTTNDFNEFRTEGLIALEESETQDFEVKFFNPDGSYGAMCGNGGRCAVSFAKKLNLIKDNAAVKFEMANDIYEASINDDGTISLTFPPYRKIDDNISLELEGMSLNVAFVDVGSDHAVIEYNSMNLQEDFRLFDIDKYGKSVRFHHIFEPAGVNANFYLIESGSVQLRTYERGVEAETGACGTGAIATALVCHLRHGLSFPVKIIPPSRQPLTVEAFFENEKVKKIVLTGGAEVINRKKIEIPDTFFEAKYD